MPVTDSPGKRGLARIIFIKIFGFHSFI